METTLMSDEETFHRISPSSSQSSVAGCCPRRNMRFVRSSRLTALWDPDMTLVMGVFGEEVTIQ